MSISVSTGIWSAKKSSTLSRSLSVSKSSRGSKPPTDTTPLGTDAFVFCSSTTARSALTSELSTAELEGFTSITFFPLKIASKSSAEISGICAFRTFSTVSSTTFSISPSQKFTNFSKAVSPHRTKLSLETKSKSTDPCRFTTIQGKIDGNSEFILPTVKSTPRAPRTSVQSSLVVTISTA